MTIESRKRLIISECNCGEVFQNVNLKKHLQNLKSKGIETHGKVRSVYYCCPCNKWGVEGQAFNHDKCGYIRLPKEAMKAVLRKQTPANRDDLLAAKAKKEKAKAEKKTDDKPTTEETDDKATAEKAGDRTTAEKTEDRAKAEKSKDKPDNTSESEVAAGNLVILMEGDKVERLTDSESDIVVPKKRGFSIDLDSSLSSLTSEEEEVASKRHRTSSPVSGTTTPQPPPSISVSPIEVFHPPSQATVVSQTVAKNNLMDHNSRLTRQIAELNTQLGIYRAKEDLTKRLTSKNMEIKEELSKVSQELEREREDRKKVEEDKKEAVERLMSAMREMERERERRRRRR